jgi:predicted nucleotidyltransferase
MKYGLPEDVIEKILEVFKRYPQINEAIIYGSRAKNNHKKGSDVDITLKGNEITLEIINKISHELDILPTPYTYDLSVFDKITNQDLLDHIKRVGKVLYIKD